MNPLASSLTFCLLVLLSGQTFAGTIGDSAAQEKCRTLHPGATIDSSPDTAYLNQQCLLNCAFGGHVWTHFMNEELPCSGSNITKVCLLRSFAGSQNNLIFLSLLQFCHNGECVTADKLPLGSLSIDIESASLAVESANLQVTSCIQNHTVNTEVTTFPLADHGSCLTCSTPISRSTDFAFWGHHCSDDETAVFSDQAHVAFEVWAREGAQRSFLGGATLTVPELATGERNGKLLRLPLKAGDVAGQVSVRVTWTAIN